MRMVENMRVRFFMVENMELENFCLKMEPIMKVSLGEIKWMGKVYSSTQKIVQLMMVNGVTINFMVKGYFTTKTLSN